MNHRSPRDAPGSGPSLRSLIDAARAYGPSPDQLARIARSLPVQDTPAATRDARPRRASPGRRRLAAFAAISGLAAALVLGVQLASRPVETAPLARASADWPASAPVAPSPSTVAPAPDEPSAAPLLDPGAATRAAPSAGANGSSHLRAPPRPAWPASLEAMQAPDAGPGPSPLPPSGSGAEDAGRTAAEAAEGDLLDRAAIVLDRSPAEALRLADQHRAGFPSSGLGPEREVIAVRALLLLGRADEAKARGARFLQQYPSSARRRLVEAMLAP